MTTGTVTLNRVLRAPAERVYRAFLDPAALCKWLPPHGFTCQVHALDARVGGQYRMSFANWSTGYVHSFGGTYLELSPHQRITHTDAFDDALLPGQMTTTITFTPVSCGTQLDIVQSGIPEAITPADCYLGWQESLDLLKLLVEPDIPDGF